MVLVISVIVCVFRNLCWWLEQSLQASGGDFGQQLFVLLCVDVVACDAVCGLSQHLMSMVIGSVVMSSYATHVL